MKRKTLARHTAELIAAELFTWGPKEKARRLVMELTDRRPLDGPGWCEEAVVDKIEGLLKRRHVGKGVVVK